MATAPPDPEPSASGLPRTPDAIAAALGPERRTQLWAELGRAPTGAAFERLLDVWACRARLDQRPDRAERADAARTGRLPTTTWEEIRRARNAGPGAPT
ncbi:hypothetical protein ACIGZJ_31120 [Kitasatospora sp. NPDC052868]|uniref:hypothetical protein n=1 Tax=Kitasatospora sp. NPDC052868 TaxID=3364060 RepID=UPI0037C93C40